MKVETRFYLLPIGSDRIVYLFGCLIVFKIRFLRTWQSSPIFVAISTTFALLVSTVGRNRVYHFVIYTSYIIPCIKPEL